jgi:hypothetical protein
MPDPIATLLADLELQAAIVRDVANECRIAHAFGNRQTAADAASLMRHKVNEVFSLWVRVIRAYEAEGLLTVTDLREIPSEPST